MRQEGCARDEPLSADSPARQLAPGKRAANGSWREPEVVREIPYLTDVRKRDSSEGNDRGVRGGGMRKRHTPWMGMLAGANPTTILRKSTSAHATCRGSSWRALPTLYVICRSLMP